MVQADYLLGQMTQLSNPVIVTGDFNTMGHDAHPRTLKQSFLTSVASFHFWLTQLLFFVGPFPGLNYVLYPINNFKNSHDPTAANVPVLAPNPEKHLFDDVLRFRFAAGSSFGTAKKTGASTAVGARLPIAISGAGRVSRLRFFSRKPITA